MVLCSPCWNWYISPVTYNKIQIPQYSPGQILLSKWPKPPKRSTEADVHRKGRWFHPDCLPMVILPALCSSPAMYRCPRWFRGTRARLLGAVGLSKRKRNSLRFPSKILLNVEKHWSGCCTRISASQTPRVVPWEPRAARSLPKASWWHLTVPPHPCAAAPTLSLAGLLHRSCHQMGPRGR